MARSPSSPIILPCPAKRVSAFSVVDGSVYRPPPVSSAPLRQTGASTTRPFRHKWTLHFLFTPRENRERVRVFLVEPKCCFHAGDFVARRERSPRFVRVLAAGFVAQPDSCRLPSIPVDSALGRLGATRACERGRVRAGPCA